MTKKAKSEYMREYRNRNLEKFLAMERARVRTPEYYAGRRAKWAEQREEHAEKLRVKKLARTVEQVAADKEKERIRSLERYRQNPQKILARGKIYREENREKRSAIVKRSTEKHAEKRRAYAKAYHQKNKERIAAYHHSRLAVHREQIRVRKERDVNFRIRLNLSNRLHAAVKRCKTNKCDKTAAMVGCDLALLKLHLQAQFKPGMSWANYGEWHIDHRIPCAEFDLREPAQQLRCFHYSNLQPLWAIDNLRKGRKLATLFA